MGQIKFFPISRIKSLPCEAECENRYRMQAEIRNHYRKFIENEKDLYVRVIQLSRMSFMMRRSIEVVQAAP